MLDPKIVQNLAESLEIGCEVSSYMHRTTFEVYHVTPDCSFAYDEEGEFDDVEDDVDSPVVEKDEAEDDELSEDLPDWIREERKKLREIRMGEDWIELPSSFEVNEWAIMRDFAREQSILRDELLDSIHRKGAFRAFKSKLDHYGLTDQWYAFKRAALTDTIINWLERHGYDVGEPDDSE